MSYLNFGRVNKCSQENLEPTAQKEEEEAVGRFSQRTGRAGILAGIPGWISEITSHRNMILIVTQEYSVLTTFEVENRDLNILENVSKEKYIPNSNG